MPVVWRKQLTTGNELIDLDHKYLLSLFNSIELAISKPELLRYLPVFYKQLLDFSREHFAREERIQLKIQYPGFAEHKQGHQRLLDHLGALGRQIEAELGPLHDGCDHHHDPLEHLEGDPEAVRQRLETEVVSIAREWVIDHVVKTDKQVLPYLKDLPPNFA